MLSTWVHMLSTWVHMLKGYKSEPSARSHPQHTRSNNNMKASLALSLLSLASTAFAIAPAVETAQPVVDTSKAGTPASATPVEEKKAPRVKTPSDDILARKSRVDYKLRFLLEHKLVESGKNPLTMADAEYSKGLKELVTKYSKNADLTQAVEETAAILDRKYDALYELVGRVTPTNLISSERSDIRKLVADAHKYKEFMALFDRKDDAVLPTKEAILDVLNKKSSPAVLNTEIGWIFSNKLELDAREKLGFANQLEHYYEKYAFAKSLKDADLKNYLTEMKLPVSADNKANIATFCRRIEAAAYFELKAKLSKKAAEQSTATSQVTPKEEYRYNMTMISIISVSVLALAVVGYFVIKRLGASDAEDELDV